MSPLSDPSLEAASKPLSKPYLDRLGFSEGYELLYCIALGYPDETPDAKPRKDDMIKYVE